MLAFSWSKQQVFTYVWPTPVSHSALHLYWMKVISPLADHRISNSYTALSRSVASLWLSEAINIKGSVMHKNKDYFFFLSSRSCDILQSNVWNAALLAETTAGKLKYPSMLMYSVTEIETGRICVSKTNKKDWNDKSTSCGIHRNSNGPEWRFLLLR